MPCFVSFQVGTSALTLITPIADYNQTSSFQLTYQKRAPDHIVGQGGMAPELARHKYQKGRAIVFGSGFVHSTEPGAAADGECHSYLCFTFGTDDMEAWPDITSTIGTQSRLFIQPSGELVFSEFGKDLEALEQARANGTISEDEYRQLYHEGLY